MERTTTKAAEKKHVFPCTTQNSALSGNIYETPIPALVRDDIIRGFWHQALSPQDKCNDFDWDTYFIYYTKQCIQALHNCGRYISIRNHQDILDVVCHLKDLSTKDTIKKILKLKLRELNGEKEADALLEGSINLTARLFLMMDIGVLSLGYSGRRELNWNEGSLKDFVHDHFNQPQVLGHENVKLEKIFTARNLDRIAGIKIEWTDNLADHLHMVGNDDEKVAIFHHASFLKGHQRYFLHLPLSEVTQLSSTVKYFLAVSLRKP